MMRTILLAALFAQGTSDPSLPLKPVTSWSVDYANTKCVAGRRYGGTEAPMTLRFESGLFAKSIDTVVVGDRKRIGRPGTVTVAIQTPERLVIEKITGSRRDLPDGKAALLGFPIKLADLDPLVGVQSVTIQSTDGPPIVLALSMTRALVDAFAKCKADMLKSYGFDPAKVAAVATLADSINPAAWLTQADYPAAAFKAGQTGRVVVGWTITADGRITDCRILESSGVAELDQASCDAVTRRGRYRRPALDAAGKPIESYATRFAVWALPR